MAGITFVGENCVVLSKPNRFCDRHLSVSSATVGWNHYQILIEPTTKILFGPALGRIQ